MTCLITGCALISGGRAVWGDLHRIGDCYVFNAVVDRRSSEAAWSAGTDHKLYVDATHCSHYLERRGVACFPVSEAQLSTAAQDYIGDGYY